MDKQDELKPEDRVEVYCLVLDDACHEWHRGTVIYWSSVWTQVKVDRTSDVLPYHWSHVRPLPLLEQLAEL